MEDCYAFVQNKLGTNAWIPLYIHQNIPKTADDFFLFSALAPQDLKEDILSVYDWEITISSFRPGHIIRHENSIRNAQYYRFGRDDAIEPIIVQRYFYGMKETFFDVSEEFRHLYNLYYDEYEGTYKVILDDGNEEDVVKTSKDSVVINAKYLKEFLAIKQCILILYINIDRFSLGNLSDLGELPTQEIRKTSSINCSMSICDCDWCQNGSNIYSRLIGKKVIPGLKEFDPENFSPGSINTDEYLDFIIGIDPEGKEITFTCDEDKLANFFGKNPGKPNYVTPVFFKREVFEKYYANPEKYSVHDGHLNCGGLWSLRLDNNHEKYVIVMLGDLGQLPLSEQQYWRSFNVKPDGKFSQVALKRGFAAEWTDPSMKDLIFKGKFERFQDAWKGKYGWDLFLPLAEGDEHYFKKIRVPLKESQSEFDELVLAITKVLIDSLNEEKIQEKLSSKNPNERGITKLERLLGEEGITNCEEHIKFLRRLQNLKSTTASHRKGNEYKKAEGDWEIGRKRYKDVYCEILDHATRLLEFLEGISI